MRRPMFCSVFRLVPQRTCFFDLILFEYDYRVGRYKCVSFESKSNIPKFNDNACNGDESIIGSLYLHNKYNMAAKIKKLLHLPTKSKHNNSIKETKPIGDGFALESAEEHNIEQERTIVPKWSLLTHAETHIPVNTSGETCIGQVCTKRLMKELKIMQQAEEFGKGICSVELIDNNLCEWSIHLHTIDEDSDLAKDMKQHNVADIHLNLSFPKNFPFSPPFMCVISPRIRNGFILDDGAICMELLTPQGWASAYTVEALILQFSASLVKANGRIDAKKLSKPYNHKAAERTFKGLLKIHSKYGWVSPPATEG